MSKKDKSNAKKYDNRKKEYDQKRAGQRTRNWTVIFYPEDLPDDWKEQLDGLMVKWIEGPLHDQDFNSDGSPKKPHHHTLWMFGSVKTAEQVEQMFKDLFGESESGSIIGTATPKIANDRSGIVRYMAHMDNPEKAQYDPNEIIGHNGVDPSEILRYSATETREMLVAMEEYIEDHGIIELSDFSAAIRYDHPEWYTILTTKMTMYFTAFIRSRRHRAEYKLQNEQLQQQLLSGSDRKVDPETGEIL